MNSNLLSNLIFTNVDIASNEVITKTSLNRNIFTLLSNDIILSNNSENIYDNMGRLMPYTDGKIYNKGDLVLFLDISYIDDGIFKKKHIDNVYLLKSLQNNNSSFPKKQIVNNIPIFDASGWRNENEFGSIFYKNTALDLFIKNYLNLNLNKLHESNVKYHKFGLLSSLQDVKEKVLNVNLENGNPNRTRIFFPTFCGVIEPNGNIINGIYRKWDNGLLEYNITYKIGDMISAKKYDSNKNVMDEVNVLSANSLVIKDNSKLESDDYNENNRYFLSANDYSIFNIAGDNNIKDINGLRQTNLNKYINVFTGNIKFPIKFKDLNYMIFNSSSIASVYGPAVLNPNVNTITYVNKTVKSITAVCILNSFDNDVHDVGIGNNIFHCQIIGRWK